jgi:hypothetical protein
LGHIDKKYSTIKEYHNWCWATSPQPKPVQILNIFWLFQNSRVGFQNFSSTPCKMTEKLKISHEHVCLPIQPPV